MKKAVLLIIFLFSLVLCQADNFCESTKRFYDELGKNDALSKAVLEDEKLIDDWINLDKAGVGKQIKNNIDELEDFRFIQEKLGKSSDEAINDIKNAGDYDSWKAVETEKVFQVIQDGNTGLISSLKASNPGLSNKEILDIAKNDIQVPRHPFGYTKEKFIEAQDFIKKELLNRGIKDAEGFATGSRITGMVTNPNKTAEFGQAIVDFSKKDLDITIITSTPLTSHQINKIAADFKEKFGNKLGIRYVTDKRQVPYLPIYGQLPINIK